MERVSYPVITPEAARGIFDAILMKPVEKPEAGKRGNKIGFRWVITRLGIVNKGAMFSILRNELGGDGYGKNHQAPETAKGYDINAKKVRAQRNSLILSGGTDGNGDRKMLEYLIEAEIVISRGERNDTRRPSNIFLLNKYYQMFLRRAKKGQSFYQPFLGCREFSVSEWEIVKELPKEIDGQPSSEDFGTIFHKFDFSPVWNHWGHKKNVPRPQEGWREDSHLPVARFFHAVAEHGWIKVPIEEVLPC